MSAGRLQGTPTAPLIFIFNVHFNVHFSDNLANNVSYYFIENYCGNLDDIADGTLTIEGNGEFGLTY